MTTLHRHVQPHGAKSHAWHCLLWAAVLFRTQLMINKAIVSVSL